MSETGTGKVRNLLTVEETAEELRISRAGIFKLIKAGKLFSVKVGGRRFVRRAAIETFLRRNEKAGL